MLCNLQKNIKAKISEYLAFQIFPDRSFNEYMFVYESVLEKTKVFVCMKLRHFYQSLKLLHKIKQPISLKL